MTLALDEGVVGRLELALVEIDRHGGEGRDDEQHPATMSGRRRFGGAGTAGSG